MILSPHDGDAIANDYDLIVLGAGAAGMTAALVGAINNLRVLLIEKSLQVGGTSARSAGTLWIPGNYFLPADVAKDDVDKARSYLNSLVGHNSPSELREAFLTHGPAMLRYLRDHSGVVFKHCPRHADYHPEHPGARQGGRPVEAEIFDARLLGEFFKALRAPIDEFMVLGGMMLSKADIDLLLTARKRPAGAAHALSLGARYLRDRVSYARGTRLSMGNALCAALLHECIKVDVSILLSADVVSVTRVSTKAGQSHQLNIEHAGATRTILARQGVVFAGGGFSGGQIGTQPTPA